MGVKLSSSSLVQTELWRKKSPTGLTPFYVLILSCMRGMTFLQNIYFEAKLGIIFRFELKHDIDFILRFGAMLPLFSFINFTIIKHTFNIYCIYTSSQVPLLLSSWLAFGRGPPLRCRAEIRTQACLTASRHAIV